MLLGKPYDLFDSLSVLHLPKICGSLEKVLFHYITWCLEGDGAIPAGDIIQNECRDTLPK